MNLLNFYIYFKIQKKRCDFKFTSLKTDFLPNFFHIMYENRIFKPKNRLKNPLKTLIFQTFILCHHV